MNGSNASWGRGAAPPRNAPPTLGSVQIRALIAGILGAAAACATDPNAPPEVAFDHVACEHCGMLVSEPAYAAVLDLGDGHSRGERLVFDDPGCLFRYVVEQGPSVARMWFSVAEAPNGSWVRESAVAFTTGNRSPMGSGLRAVPAGTAGSVAVGEASAVALGGAR